MARPTKYKVEYIKVAQKLCELGATDYEIAEALGVTKKTLYSWKTSNPKFAEAFTLGKQKSDDRVEHSLYAKATGYTFESEKIFQFQGQVVRASCIEHVPPDTTACIFWLKNRRPETYRAQENTNSVEDLAESLRSLMDKLPE